MSDFQHLISSIERHVQRRMPYHRSVSSYLANTQILIRRVDRYRRSVAANYPAALLRPRQQPRVPVSIVARACTCTWGHKRS